MNQSSRRTFLAAAGAGALLGAARDLPAAAVPLSPRTEGKRILVLGGTGFLGPHFVRAAMARGHVLTLFNRGKTNPQLFPDVEKLVGDREKGELQALEGRSFDAVVDTSGYVPAHVEATARMFAAETTHYTFISTISVYDKFGERPDVFDETSSVGEVSDEDAAKVNTIRGSMPFYGPLKARCEQAALQAKPGRTFVVRPGLIVGPGDTTDRFTWWPVRIDQGGAVLAPGDKDGLIQVIDVRDLADWMVHGIEQQLAGTYNADGFDGRVSMEEFLHGCKLATSKPVELVWGSEEFLKEHEVGAWMEMPLWIPREGRSIAANDRARAAGLRFRPLADTIRDTLAWAKSERGDRPFARTGVKPDKEARLIALLRGAKKG